MVTILTAPEPQTQLMTMVLTLGDVQQGATAQILLCGPAADIALKAAPRQRHNRPAPTRCQPARPDANVDGATQRQSRGLRALSAQH
jgi:hypothetical protein